MLNLFQHPFLSLDHRNYGDTELRDYGDSALNSTPTGPVVTVLLRCTRIQSATPALAGAGSPVAPAPDSSPPRHFWYFGDSYFGDSAFISYLHKDERGSVIALTNASGGIIAINAYDDYGIPASTNIGRFQYTGQT